MRQGSKSRVSRGRRRSGGCGGAAGAAERWVRRSGGCGGAAGAAAGAAGAAGASAAVSDAGAAVSEAEAGEAVEAVEAAAEAAKSMAPADSGGSGKCTGTGYPDGPRAATQRALIEAVRMILQRSLMHYSGQRHHKSMRHYTIDGGITVVYEAFLLSGVRLQELRRLASASSFRAVRWLWGVVCERGGVSHVSVGQSSAAVRDGRKR